MRSDKRWDYWIRAPHSEQKHLGSPVPGESDGGESKFRSRSTYVEQGLNRFALGNETFARPPREPGKSVRSDGAPLRGRSAPASQKAR